MSSAARDYENTQEERDELARTVRAMPKPKGTRIERICWIKENHTAARVEGKLFDAFTAGMVICIYDALNAENQAKFVGLPLLKMVDVGWKLYKKYAK